MAKAKQSAKKSKEEKDEKDVKKSSSSAASEKKNSKKKDSDKPTTKKVEKKTDSKKAAQSSEEKKVESEKKEDVKKAAGKTEKKEVSTKQSASKKDSKKETEEEEGGSNGMMIGAIVVLLLLVAGVASYAIWGGGFGNDDSTQRANTNAEVYVDIEGNVVEEDSPAAIIPRRIDGMMVAREDANDIPSCVMIENAAFGGVRPQSGLNSASVVYEVIVEGGITRFMAVFAGEESDEVGPIRSARDTYLEFASEYNCMYTHAGGSYTAMTAIPRFGMRDLDALREAQFFWRDSSRYAPHNLFSSTENLEEAIVAHSWHLEDEPDYTSWNFVEAIGAPDADAAEAEEDTVTEATEDGAVEEEETAGTNDTEDGETESAADETVVANGEEAVNQVKILFGGSYNSQYDFNEEGNYYERTNGGVLQTDAATGETLRTNNIVIMHVGSGTSIEGKGRINWPVTGEGDVEIFHDGRVYYGTWKKPTRTERTQFYDADGELLPLVQGNTWVEVVPPHITVEKS